MHDESHYSFALVQPSSSSSTQVQSLSTLLLTGELKKLLEQSIYSSINSQQSSKLGTVLARFDLSQLHLEIEALLDNDSQTHSATHSAQLNPKSQRKDDPRLSTIALLVHGFAMLVLKSCQTLQISVNELVLALNKPFAAGNRNSDANKPTKKQPVARKRARPFAEKREAGGGNLVADQEQVEQKAVPFEEMGVAHNLSIGQMMRDNRTQTEVEEQLSLQVAEEDLLLQGQRRASQASSSAKTEIALQQHPQQQTFFAAENADFRRRMAANASHSGGEEENLSHFSFEGEENALLALTRQYQESFYAGQRQRTTLQREKNDAENLWERYLQYEGEEDLNFGSNSYNEVDYSTKKRTAHKKHVVNLKQFIDEEVDLSEVKVPDFTQEVIKKVTRQKIDLQEKEEWICRVAQLYSAIDSETWQAVFQETTSLSFMQQLPTVRGGGNVQAAGVAQDLDYSVSSFVHLQRALLNDDMPSVQSRSTPPRLLQAQVQNSSQVSSAIIPLAGVHISDKNASSPSFNHNNPFSTSESKLFSHNNRLPPSNDAEEQITPITEQFTGEDFSNTADLLLRQKLPESAKRLEQDIKRELNGAWRQFDFATTFLRGKSKAVKAALFYDLMLLAAIENGEYEIAARGELCPSEKNQAFPSIAIINIKKY